MIGIAPVHQGTSILGLAPLIERIRSLKVHLLGGVNVVGEVAPALQELLSTSAFIHKLNEGGDTLPDVFQANIAA
ncbi:hypothetical protein BGX33_000696, partial [Mortierella sp. NVP41]